MGAGAWRGGCRFEKKGRNVNILFSSRPDDYVRSEKSAKTFVRNTKKISTHIISTAKLDMITDKMIGNRGVVVKGRVGRVLLRKPKPLNINKHGHFLKNEILYRECVGGLYRLGSTHLKVLKST